MTPLLPPSFALPFTRPSLRYRGIVSHAPFCTLPGRCAGRTGLGSSEPRDNSIHSWPSKNCSFRSFPSHFESGTALTLGRSPALHPPGGASPARSERRSCGCPMPRLRRCCACRSRSCYRNDRPIRTSFILSLVRSSFAGMNPDSSLTLPHSSMPRKPSLRSHCLWALEWR